MSNTINWDSRYVRSCRHEVVEKYGDGAHCVYFWEDDNNEVFYVGSGKGYRFNNLCARSDEFAKEYNSRVNPHPRIVAYGMEKEESLLLESQLTKVFLELGFPLVNKDCVPQTLTYNGITRTYGAWGRDIGVDGGTIKIRIEKLGWPIERALFTPSTREARRQLMAERRMKKVKV